MKRIACILVLTVISGTARADFVSEVHCFEYGDDMHAIPSAAPPIGSRFLLAGILDSAVASVNGASLPRFSYADTDYQVGGVVTGYQTGPLGTTYDLAGPPVPLLMQFHGNTRGAAHFLLAPEFGFVPFDDPHRMELSGMIVSGSGTAFVFDGPNLVPLYDFSTFAGGGSFSGRFSGPNFNQLLLTGQPPFVRASFEWSMAAAPEPPSFLLAAIGAASLAALRFVLVGLTAYRLQGR